MPGNPAPDRFGRATMQPALSGVEASSPVGSSFTMPSMSHPLLLGHRGARATQSLPENTLASFDLALVHGCDGFEFDVRQTADGRAVICHDPKLHGIEIAHAGPTDLAELSTLEQVLQRYQARAFLDIEIKVAGLETAVRNALRAHPPQRGYVVSSFLPEALLALRALAPDLPLGLICETPSELATWEQIPVQFVIPHDALIDIDLCTALHAAGKKIFVWTVNQREQMVHFKDLGVEGIISDDTEMLAQLRT
jgi:glycerophosphoryl diester phosphodiesterase